MAKTKLKIFLVKANLVPNSRFSRGNVTIPTIVKVVKNAAAGTIPTPEFTNVPTNGKAMKAGIKVIVPKAADATVAIMRDCFPINWAIPCGGSIVRSNPIRKIIDRILPSMPFPMPNAILSACFVFDLFLMKDTIRKMAVPIHIRSVKISIEILLF